MVKEKPAHLICNLFPHQALEERSSVGVCMLLANGIVTTFQCFHAYRVVYYER